MGLPLLRSSQSTLLGLCAGRALTVLAVARGAWTTTQRGGNDTVTYLVSLASIALSILLTTFDSPVENAVTSLIFIGFPAMAAASALVPPSVGYFGQTVQFCFLAVIAMITGASYAAKGLRRETVDKDRAFSNLFVWQGAVVLFVVVASGFASSAPVPNAAWRLSNGLVVKPVSVGGGPVSQPFVIGDRCYVVDYSLGLTEVDLRRGEVTARMRPPHPKPPNLGAEGAEPVRQEGLPHLALFYGDKSAKVQFAYPYPLKVEKDSEIVEDRSRYIWIDVSLPLPYENSVANWRIGQEPDGETISTLDPGPDVHIVTLGDCYIDRTRVSSSAKWVNTVTPDGESSLYLGHSDWEWVVAAGDNQALICTDSGKLFIVTRPR